jgi:hypothetical protein
MTPELTRSQTIRYIGTNPYNGRYYYLLNSYSNASGITDGTVAKIYSMLPGNLNSINCIATLPFLGNIENNNMGDIDCKWLGDDLYVYALSSNNGFGAYKVSGLYEQPVNRSDNRFALLWENSIEGNNLPGFYAREDNSDNITGLAYGTVGGEKSVYVVKKIYTDPDQPKETEDIWGPSGNSRKNIFIYDADNGNIKGELSISGIWGKEIHDGTVSDDGKLLISFVVNAEGQTMNVYSFPDNQHVGDVSQVAFAYDLEWVSPLEGGSLGSNIDVVGSVAEGNAVLYAASASSTATNYVHTFGMSAPNVWEGFFAAEEFTITSGGKGSVSVKPDKSFYWNAAGEKFLYHNGTALSNNESTLDGSIIRYITTKDGRDYIAVLNRNKVDVYSLDPGQPNTKTLWGSSPVLGPINSSIGDIEVGFDSENAPILYVLSSRNGLAAWKLNLNATGIPENKPAKKVSFFVNPALQSISFSETVKTAKLLGIDGKTIRTAVNTNKLDIQSLKGVFIVSCTDAKGEIVTKKVNL